jgi:hypothetical protein
MCAPILQNALELSRKADECKPLMVGLPLSMAFFSPKEVAPATQKAIGMSNKSDLGEALQLATRSVTVPQPFHNRSTTVPQPFIATVPATIPATVPATFPATVPATVPETVPMTISATVPATVRCYNRPSNRSTMLKAVLKPHASSA